MRLKELQRSRSSADNSSTIRSWFVASAEGRPGVVKLGGRPAARPTEGLQPSAPSADSERNHVPATATACQSHRRRGPDPTVHGPVHAHTSKPRSSGREKSNRSRWRHSGIESDQNLRLRHAFAGGERGGAPA